MIRDFYCYRDIFAISPDLKATSWAVLSEKTGRLLACGVVEPFAQVNVTKSTFEIRKLIQKAWEERVGYSKSPKLVVFDAPLYDSKYLTFLSGMLTEKLLARNASLPKDRIASPTNHRGLVLSLDANSKKVLAQALIEISRDHRHRIYDAIQLGKWAFEQSTLA